MAPAVGALSARSFCPVGGAIPVSERFYRNRPINSKPPQTKCVCGGAGGASVGRGGCDPPLLNCVQVLTQLPSRRVSDTRTCSRSGFSVAVLHWPLTVLGYLLSQSQPSLKVKHYMTHHKPLTEELIQLDPVFAHAPSSGGPSRP